MSKRRAFLIVQATLCILIAVLLAVFAIRIFMEGSAWQAAGHPSDWIYTREKAGGALLAVLPLFCVSAAMTVIGVVKGIKDEEAEKPVQDVELARNLTCARVTKPSAEMLRERELQKKLLIAGVAGFGACMIPILLYVTNSTHFAQTDPEERRRPGSKQRRRQVSSRIWKLCKLMRGFITQIPRRLRDGFSRGTS